MGIAGRKDDVDDAIHVSHGDTVRHERPDKVFTTSRAPADPKSLIGKRGPGKRQAEGAVKNGRSTSPAKTRGRPRNRRRGRSRKTPRRRRFFRVALKRQPAFLRLSPAHQSAAWRYHGYDDDATGLLCP